MMDDNCLVNVLHEHVVWSGQVKSGGTLGVSVCVAVGVEE